MTLSRIAVAFWPNVAPLFRSVADLGAILFILAPLFFRPVIFFKFVACTSRRFEMINPVFF